MAGLPLGGIGGRLCADFPGGSGGGFTDLVFVSCGKFLAGGGGLFTDFTFVGCRGGAGRGFA